MAEEASGSYLARQRGKGYTNSIVTLTGRTGREQHDNFADSHHRNRQ